MLRDPVFYNSVRGFVAEISHFGPLQARPAARRSKRPVPRTVPAARLSHPACLRLPPAVSHTPPIAVRRSTPAARAAVRIAAPPRTVPLSACRLPRASDCRPPPTPAVRAAVRIAAPPRTVPAVRLPSPTCLRLPACRPPHTSDCRPPPTPAVRAAARIAAPHARFRLSACRPPHASGCRLPSPTHLRLPSAAHACRPCRRPHRRPAHGSGCPPRVLPVAVRVARRPITPRPPPDGSAFPAPASTGRPALFFWKIRNVPKIALQPYAAVI